VNRIRGGRLGLRGLVKRGRIRNWEPLLINLRPDIVVQVGI